MGTWGHKPLENDDALDLQGDFDESGDVAILRNALETIYDAPKDAPIDASEASQAVAAAEIAIEKNLLQEDRRMMQEVLKRILDKSELKELWEEAGELKEWQTSVQDILSQLLDA